MLQAISDITNICLVRGRLVTMQRPEYAPSSSNQWRYLALRHDNSAATVFAPAYPKQLPDVSFGVPANAAAGGADQITCALTSTPAARRCECAKAAQCLVAACAHHMSLVFIVFSYLGCFRMDSYACA
jgi:hypothetical protein